MFVIYAISWNKTECRRHHQSKKKKSSDFLIISFINISLALFPKKNPPLSNDHAMAITFNLHVRCAYARDLALKCHWLEED
jgi:hypothetical protein